MTPRQVRAGLRSRFAHIGFFEQGSRFVCRSGELVHAVEVCAVRRLAGTVEIHHRVSLGEQEAPLLSEEIASQGLDSPYPRVWQAGSVDPGLVSQQVDAIRQAFQVRSDLAHFWSDRPHLKPESGWTDAAASSAPNSLSAAESSKALQGLAQGILGDAFEKVPADLDFDLWASRQESEGFRHCAYVEANQSATLAHLVVFSFPTRRLAGGLRADSGIRMLMLAPKRALFGRGRPILLPMSISQAGGHEHGRDALAEDVRNALAEHVRHHPPHLLPR